jgi:hypothetical protein
MPGRFVRAEHARVRSSRGIIAAAGGLRGFVRGAARKKLNPDG